MAPHSQDLLANSHPKLALLGDVYVEASLTWLSTGRARRGIQSTGWRLLAEDGAQLVPIESQSKSVFFRKSRDLYLSVFVIERPDPLQFTLVSGVVLPLADLQFAFDSGRERFHAA